MRWLLILLLAGCATAPPVGSLEEIKDGQRKEMYEECQETFRKAEMARPFKTVYPDDDPMYRHTFCARRAKRLVR